MLDVFYKMYDLLIFVIIAFSLFSTFAIGLAIFMTSKNQENILKEINEELVRIRKACENKNNDN